MPPPPLAVDKVPPAAKKRRLFTELTELYNHKCFEGRIVRYSHKSKCCDCTMKLQIYFPPRYFEVGANGKPLPFLYILMGLTTDDEFSSERMDVARWASEIGMPVVFPDTSPRDTSIEGEGEDYRWGLSAGFYVDAVTVPWKRHYKMYTYVTSELPEIIATSFPNLDTNKCSVLGHSMGGHGAMVVHLRNPGMYHSCSVFAGLCNPTCPDALWGPVVLRKYLGDDEESWKMYDAVELVKRYKGEQIEIMYEIGTKDAYFNADIFPMHLPKACKANDRVKLRFTLREGYHHSSPYCATFMEEHMRYHAKALGY